MKKHLCKKHHIRGRAGQLRFCLRQDIDPASYGACQPEEIPGYQPHGADVMLLVKRLMADTSPVRVICVTPASVCKQLRIAFQQPSGNDAKRPISEQCRRNIRSMAPLCQNQGIISADGRAYLTNWVDGTLPQQPRPTAYKCLTFRRHRVPAGVPDARPIVWDTPRRPRIITVLPSDHVVAESDEDEGPVGMDVLED